MSSAPGGTLYLDSSAIVKLVIREAETHVLQEELMGWPLIATSSVAAIEVRRAIKRAAADGRPDILDDQQVDDVLAALIEMVLTDHIRQTAWALDPAELRTLDAIHVASALALGDDLAAIVTYDARMQAAVERYGLAVLAPGR